MEDLKTNGVSGVPHSQPPPHPSEPHSLPGIAAGQDTHLAGPMFLIYGPLHAVITVGHFVGCHILDVTEITGPLGDDSRHLPLSAQVNLRKNTVLAWNLFRKV